jgi:sugar-specific transcriptional regulator TrmB
MADLRDVGLSKYEARAYRSLLEVGPTTAKELSEASGVPMGRIYDVLNSLQQHRLARSQTASRPKKYVAVEPETALDRLLEEKRRDLRQRERQYEEAVEELASELDSSDPADQVDEQFWTAAVGAEETADLLLERLSAADDRIVMVSSTTSSGLELGDIGTAVTEELAAAVDRGVTVSVLLADSVPAQLSPQVGQRYADTLADHDEFAVRTHPEVQGTVTLVDDTETCLEVPNPVEAGSTFALIDLKDPEFTADVRERFTERWAEAKPFTFSLG